MSWYFTCSSSLSRELGVPASTRSITRNEPGQLPSGRGAVLDHFEGRTYAGWTHHVVLAAVAFTFLLADRTRTSARRPAPNAAGRTRLVS